jgi:hypothetical protein
MDEGQGSICGGQPGTGEYRGERAHSAEGGRYQSPAQGRVSDSGLYTNRRSPESHAAQPEGRTDQASLRATATPRSDQEGMRVLTPMPISEPISTLWTAVISTVRRRIDDRSPPSRRESWPSNALTRTLIGGGWI